MNDKATLTYASHGWCLITRVFGQPTVVLLAISFYSGFKTLKSSTFASSQLFDNLYASSGMIQR